MKKGFIFVGITILIFGFAFQKENSSIQFKLIEAKPIYFNSFVDCNMAEAWIADTFRIFPGKYGEDPLWGYSNELKFADGLSPDIVFEKKPNEFIEPTMPINVKPGEEGLHGAVWFETIYQDKKDKTGKTLFALYHNENYPDTYPYRSKNKKGYINKNWPQGLTGEKTPAAVCRIGIMKSVNGGKSWNNKGIILEDNQPRMILKPHNNAVTFAGGVGDPSSIVSGNYLYIFYGEYGYAGKYDSLTYDSNKEYHGQCISIARIAVADLESPVGKAYRWNGKEYLTAYDGIGKPIPSLQIPIKDGGGAASKANTKFYWGPSVSWNNYLQAWVMLMAKSEGTSWKGNSIYISFNNNKELNQSTSQQWSVPKLLLTKQDQIIWYPSLQPVGDKGAISNKYTSLSMGKEARLFYKVQTRDTSYYVSSYRLQFSK
jgi:hypothetical protein